MDYGKSTKEGKRNIHTADQQANTVRTTFVCESAEMLFYRSGGMKERTLRHLTDQHLHRHLSAVNILVVHAFCSHISTGCCKLVWDTLIVLWHLRLNRTLQFPYVCRFLQSCVGTTQARWAVYSFIQPKYRVPAESTKNDIFIRTNAAAGTSLLFGFRGIFYLHHYMKAKFST